MLLRPASIALSFVFSVVLVSACGGSEAGGGTGGGSGGGSGGGGGGASCSDLACENGTCELTGGVPACACEPGYAGTLCDALDAPEPSAVAFWIDAADSETLTTSGALVTGWSDKGADALSSLVDADDAEKPTLVANALNGLPVVRFDGDYVSWNGFAGLTNEDEYTIFLVGSAGLEDTTFLSGEETDNAFELRAGTGAAAVEFDHVPAGGAMSQIVSRDGFSSPAAHLVTVQHTTSRMSIWIDGRFRYDEPTADANPLDADLALMAGQGFASDLVGDIAEVLIVTGTLDLAERRAIEAYLGAKWFGEAPALDPTAVAATPLWLDASDDETLTVVSGGITDWTNLGYAGGFFAQGLGADLRPQAVAAGLNGRAVARFDGGDFLVMNGLEWSGGNSYMVLAVVVPPATGGASTLFAALDADDPGIALELLPDDGLARFTHRWPAAAAGGDLVETALGDAGEPVLVTARRSGPAMSLAIVDTDAITGTASDIDAASLDLVLGAETATSPAAELTGDVAELIVVNGALANDEAQALEEWLRAKWGL